MSAFHSSSLFERPVCGFLSGTLQAGKTCGTAGVLSEFHQNSLSGTGRSIPCCPSSWGNPFLLPQ